MFESGLLLPLLQHALQTLYRLTDGLSHSLLKRRLYMVAVLQHGLLHTLDCVHLRGLSQSLFKPLAHPTKTRVKDQSKAWDQPRLLLCSRLLDDAFLHASGVADERLVPLYQLIQLGLQFWGGQCHHHFGESAMAGSKFESFLFLNFVVW